MPRVSGLLDRLDLVVEHRPQLVERRISYDLSDADGTLVGTIIQSGRDNVERTLRPRKVDNALTTFAMSEADGAVVLTLTHVQALKSRLVVCDANGVELGQFRLTNLLGRSRFSVELGGSPIATLDAATWRKRNFVMRDGDGTEIAGVDMTRGRSGDHLHDNAYRVRVLRRLDEPLRSLALAAVIAIDMILWHR